LIARFHALDTPLFNIIDEQMLVTDCTAYGLLERGCRTFSHHTNNVAESGDRNVACSNYMVISMQ
jgi:hypothetical protein